MKKIASFFLVALCAIAPLAHAVKITKVDNDLVSIMADAVFVQNMATLYGVGDEHAEGHTLSVNMVTDNSSKTYVFSVKTLAMPPRKSSTKHFVATPNPLLPGIVSVSEIVNGEWTASQDL